MKSALVVLALVLVTSSAAAETKAKIFQLGAPGLPKSLKTAPEKLTEVLAESFGAEMSIVSIEDAAEISNCSLTARSCLETIASLAGVKRILFGTIVVRDDKAIIKLTLFDVGMGESGRSFTVTGETTKDLVESLEQALDLAKQETPAPRPTPATPTPAPTIERRGATTGTWAMIIGGGIALGVGLAFMASANTLRAEIQRAPTDTREDLDRLVVLERAGKRRVEIGGGLLAIGSVVATVGIVRLVMQRSAAPEKPMLEIVPDKGGMTVMFSMGWR